MSTCRYDEMCELPHGHAGPHQSGACQWGASALAAPEAQQEQAPSRAGITGVPCPCCGCLVIPDMLKPALPLSTIERVLGDITGEPDPPTTEMDIDVTLREIYQDGWNKGIETATLALRAAVTPETPQ